MRLMRLMKNATIVATVAALSVLICGNAIASSIASVKQAWKSQHITQLKAVLPNRAAVNEFVRQLDGDVVVQPTVGQYEFTGLNNDGTVELVVTIDYSGRGFFSTVNIISYTNGRLHTDIINSDFIDIMNLKSRIVDLNGDGMHELLIPRALAVYEGAAPIPMINDVYQWSGTGYEKADANFKRYYRDRVMPQLKAALNAVENGHSTAGKQNSELIKEKYQKELGEVSNILNQ